VLRLRASSAEHILPWQRDGDGSRSRSPLAGLPLFGELLPLRNASGHLRPARGGDGELFRSIRSRPLPVTEKSRRRPKVPLTTSEYDAPVIRPTQ